jgi:uncharacterized membrane protein YhaH (DUF805 family)
MNYYTDVLKKYAVFTGRARRKEYWMFVLWNFIIAILAGIVFNLIGYIMHDWAIGMVVDLYYLAVLIPALAVLARRLHDTGRSAWWMLIGLIPLIGAIVLFVFAVLDSQPGDNKYGPNPKGISAS